MMTLRKLILFCCIALCQSILAQEKTIDLNEVTVSDSQLKDFSGSQAVVVLNDSVISRNQPSLTSLLNYNTVIYFKENGYGMVSSPSFRGTTAQQAAVIWNGININSQLNGQTDFNTITASDFNSIAVRAGGGSVIYGSSAIGGTVNLNNQLTFGKEFSNTIRTDYGSFNTLGLHYDVKYSTAKFSSQVIFSRNSSDNDYRFADSDLKNKNGQFYNNSYNLNLGYQINPRHFLKFYGQVFESQRHFSLISPSDTKTKYRDFNTRSLLEWDAFFNQFVSKVKLAFLTEKYQYFENLSLDDYSSGNADSFIAKYDLTYNLNDKIKLNSIVDFTQNNGDGSDIRSEKRQVGSAGLLFRHLITSKFSYELGVRKEITANYQSPVLFSAGSNYGISKFYSLRANVSKNFRIPTFNDLYWAGAGNPDLKPESSLQGEIGNDFRFKDFALKTTLYHIRIHDMIRWLPGNNAVFSPENTNRVSVSGLEVILEANKKAGKNNIAVDASYAYTNSQNTETGKQLIYVPFHKMTFSAVYAAQKFSFSYQHLFTGKVFTQTDNNPSKNVAPYHVSNIIADYIFGKKQLLKLGFAVRNLWNENYKSVEGRPMPGINYTMYLTLNF